MRRTLALTTVAAALLAGCGGGDDESAPTTTAADAASITIEHRYGSTTLDAAPERIVSLDNQWTDVLVALDGPLVGAALDPLMDTGRYPWQDVVPAEVEGIEVGDAIPFEAVAALRPDLIVITWAATDRETYDLLTEIAATIPLLGDEEVDAWQDIATVAGELLGTEDAAAALVAEAEARSADLAAELPGLDGKTYAMANYVPGDAIYVIADPEDGASQLFAQLGLSIDPELLDAADGASGRVTISLEQVGMLDSDLLVLLTNGADPDDIPGYAQLPAVQDGAVAVLDLAPIVGLNTPTPLSVPYSLDAIRAALEAAAT